MRKVQLQTDINNVICIFEVKTILHYIQNTKREWVKGEKVEVKSGENRPTPEVIELLHAFPILVINFWSLTAKRTRQLVSGRAASMGITFIHCFYVLKAISIIQIIYKHLQSFWKRRTIIIAFLINYWIIRN